MATTGSVPDERAPPSTLLILANDYLPKVDAGSMRHSLEVRVPMLDEDLIAFGLTLPHALRVERKGKRLLRGVAGRHLPASIAARPKQGFAARLRESRG